MPQTIRRATAYFGSEKLSYQYVKNEENYTPLFSADLKFGIEFESLINSSDKAQLRNFLQDGYQNWILSNDSTLSSNEFSDTMELKTPPLSGPKGIKEVRRVLKKVTSLNSGVNDSCGTHVHIDATKWCADANNVENYRRLLNVSRAYQYFEPVFDRLMTRARRDSGFAHTMVNVSYRPEYLIHSSQDVLQNTGQRYLKCNLQALQSHRTIEFRQHAGTLNFTKIMSWMILMQLFMRRVISERSPYFLDYERTLDGLYNFLKIETSSDALICKVKSVYNARYTRTSARAEREARA